MQLYWQRSSARGLARVICSAFLVGAALLSTSGPAAAQISSTEEYRLKLAFLYNFAKFVDWPADSFPGASDPLNICIIGRDPFDPQLERQVAERSLRGHPFVFRNLRPSDDVGGCHIIFLPASNDRFLPAIVDKLGSSGGITVGESTGFVARGGTVNFVIEGTTLRFEVNLRASQRTRSRISSRLLALARIFRE